MTKDKRGQESRLLISFQKSFKAVTVDTLSRWLKANMSQVGIDIDQFKPYSGRAASTSILLLRQLMCLFTPFWLPQVGQGSQLLQSSILIKQFFSHLGQFGQSILDTKL